MKTFLAIAFISLALLQCICLAQDCAALSPEGCSDCTATPNCGWCGPTGTCMNGTRQGPSSGRCYGDAWFFGAGACPNCNTLPNCRACLYWETTCFWCESIGQCKEWGTFVGCQERLDTCPCDVYPTCSECLQDNGCMWCGGSNNTCVSTTANCPMPAHTCPCSDNFDCTSCLEDQNQGCMWCENGGVGSCSNSPDCLAAHDCNQYCATEAKGSCDNCNALNGCIWCDSTDTCISESSVSTCPFVSHTCPDCQSHRYCDTCQDAGCVWCQNGECVAQGQNTGCTPIAQGNCNAFCEFYKDCAACNVMSGCGWCDTSSQCVDADQSTCLLAHTCSNKNNGGNSCKFDGGAFVGGMFLGIGLVAIGIGGFLFYRWKMGKKPGYSELH